MQEKMRPRLKKNPTRTKAIFLMRINNDGAISDEEMETVLVSPPDSSAASECIGEEEEESNFVMNKLRGAKKEDTFLNSLHHEFENYPLKIETPLSSFFVISLSFLNICL